MMIRDDRLVIETIVGRADASHRWHRLLLTDLEVMALSLGCRSIEVYSSQCEWVEALGYTQSGAHLTEPKETSHLPIVVYHLKKTLGASSDEGPATSSEHEDELANSLLPDLFAALHREYGNPPPAD